MTPAELHAAVWDAVTARLEMYRVLAALDAVIETVEWTIRVCEADLERLDEHEPQHDGDAIEQWQCEVCGETPCDELHRIARVYGVEDPDATPH